ncbi:MAG: SEC-C domain-containing protein [Herpetosiphon sp.]
MAKIGRNDPCFCGSGKKYKQCHALIDEAKAHRERALRQAPDTLLPKLFDDVPQFAEAIPAALRLFWNDSYNVQTVQELDQHEDRGSERFLTWFVFDYLYDGATLLSRMKDQARLELTEAEATLIHQWTDVRLQPYAIESVDKGKGFCARPLFGGDAVQVEDRAATKRLLAGDVLVVHLLPITGDVHYITGAAAHLTTDTVSALREFASVHLHDLEASQPGATYNDLIRHRSYMFNHFVMALPRDEQEISKLDGLVVTTKAMLNVVGSSLGIVHDEPNKDIVVPSETGIKAAEAAKIAEPAEHH